MTLILNLSIFLKSGGHLISYHGNVRSGRINVIYVLLNKTHSTGWAEKSTNLIIPIDLAYITSGVV